MYYDVIVVGAGPAGLFASISAARCSASVLLLEAMNSGGKKLLISGSGQCNLSHSGSVDNLLDHYGIPGSLQQKKCRRFLRPALYGFSNNDLKQFFEERGLALESSNNGKLFPSTRHARDVLAILLKEIQMLGVTYLCSSRVKNVQIDNKFSLGTEAGQDQYRCSSLILACGGSSYPGTGSRGDGFRLARELAHHIVNPVPALTPVYVKESAYRFFRDCSGIALRNTRLRIYRDNKKIASASGDLLFTYGGLSGPIVLDSSRIIQKGDLIVPAFVPDFVDVEQAEAFLLSSMKDYGKRSLVRTVQSLGLAERLCKALFTSLNIPQDMKAAELDRNSRRSLARALSGAPDAASFPVSALGSWKEAMVTGGGVSLNEVKPKNMESSLVPSLFFAGEVLDIDGDTGGYNIQAACSTGYLAGASAAVTAKGPAIQDD